MFAKDIELIIKSPPTEVIPEPVCHTGEFFQTFKEEILSILCKLFRK